VQGFLPYGAQMLAAMAIAGSRISPLDIMKELYYPYLLGICTVVFILIGQKKNVVTASAND
jgi:Na+/H+ antiporter NhaC